MRVRFLLFGLLAAGQVLGGQGFVFPRVELVQRRDYERVISICGYRNDCFFNAVRHAGIPITRDYVLRRLQAMRDDERWQTAVYFMVQQELLDGESHEEPDVRQPYQWFIDHIRRGAPVPFHAYREAWETQIPDLIDLLGEELGFDVQIVQRAEESNRLQVMREFRRGRDASVRRVTLRYTGGEIGHFDLVVTPDFEDRSNQLYPNPNFITGGNQGRIFSAMNNEVRWVLKYIQARQGYPRGHPVQEAVLMASCCPHPCIVCYRESFEDRSGQSLVLVQELVRGVNLKENRRTQRYVPLPETAIWSLLAQILLAVAHVHSKNVIHGDIKPENILIQNGFVKLCDFGLSQGNSRITHTQGGKGYQGTAYYLAPEVWEHAKPNQVPEYGQAVDMWAIGVVLHWLSENGMPFDAADVWLLSQKISNGRLMPLGGRSEPMQKLRDDLLNRNPTKRPTARQVLEQPEIRTALLGLFRNLAAPEDLRRLIGRFMNITAPENLEDMQ